MKALWNALRGRHKYGATNENQYAARRCSKITRLTRNSLTRVRVRRGAANFAHYIWRSRLLSRGEEIENVVTDLMRQCGHCLHKEGGSVVKALWNALRGRHKYGATIGNQYAARRCSMMTRLTRDSLTWVRVYSGAAIFPHYTTYLTVLCTTSTYVSWHWPPSTHRLHSLRCICTVSRTRAGLALQQNQKRQNPLQCECNTATESTALTKR